MTATLVSRSYSFEVINHNTGDIYDLVVNLPPGVTRNDALGRQIEARVQVLTNRIFTHGKTASHKGTFEGAEKISCDLLANNNFFDVEGEITSQKVHAHVQNGNLFDSLSNLKRILSETSASSSSSDEGTSNQAATTTPPRSMLGRLFRSRQTKTTNQNTKRFGMNWNSLFGGPQLKTPSHKNLSVNEVIENAYDRINDDSSDFELDLSDLDLTPSPSPTGNLVSFSNLNPTSQSSSNGGRALPSDSEEVIHSLADNENPNDEVTSEGLALTLKKRAVSNHSENSPPLLNTPSDNSSILQQFNQKLAEYPSKPTARIKYSQAIGSDESPLLPTLEDAPTIPSTSKEPQNRAITFVSNLFGFSKANKEKSSNSSLSHPPSPYGDLSLDKAHFNSTEYHNIGGMMVPTTTLFDEVFQWSDEDLLSDSEDGS